MVENGRLVGIVAANATERGQDDTTDSYRIPFARVIKAKSLWPLLRAQELKDAAIDRLREEQKRQR